MTTHEEYALARTERKVGTGYYGFVTDADKAVTLEEDLARRDLTINAIAQDQAGELIDPYHGVADLKQKILRHVSPAFVEDPVRVLRLARFAATLPDFSVATETAQLMEQMVQEGEMKALVPERVWQETARALTTLAPWRFFSVLAQAGALAQVMPGVVWDEETEQRMQHVCEHVQESMLRWAGLAARLSLDVVKLLHKKLRVPNAFAVLAKLACQYMTAIEQVSQDDRAAILDLLQHCDAMRRPERFSQLLQVVQAAGDHSSQVQCDILWQALQKIKTLSIQPLLDRGLQGRELAQAIYQLRLQAL